jgi:formylglycine-generating enzyme required for sulfatase activity
MRKIPSPTQCFLDEEATVIQIAEQGVWSPVLVRAPERWFDLAIVVEDSPSLKLWQDTVAELQTLVEQQGAFRQIRTWGLQGKKGEAIQLSLNWQPTSTPLPPRPASPLLDPTGRRIIWLISDCTSDLWDYPVIYEWLEKWGKHSPLAIVQLLPERLWSRTALGIGQPMRFHAATPGATHAMLSVGATPIYPAIEEEENASRQPAITLPVISLEPEPVSRWANVTTGVGDASVAGLKIFLNQLTPPSEYPSQPNTLTPEQRVQQFCATASITAQRLAGLMATVPVSLPVAHLIQKTLLPQSRQVHLAEVFMSGLLDAVPPPPDQTNQPTQYRFPEPVREKLIDAVPISKTTQVLDAISAYISERLGLGANKSFAALIAEYPQLKSHEQQVIQPFAEIALSTLRRLGGDYRIKADQLAPYINPAPPEPTSPNFPLLQEHHYRTAWVEVEPLQRFDFETATIVQQRQKRSPKQPEWVITKSPGYGWQRVEDLGNGVQLGLVEILGGSFQMGSPEDEPEREDNEDPQHEVTLSDFFIGKYPITQAQWWAVSALPQVNQELDPNPSYFEGADRPVEQVSWRDAVEFCARLSVKTRREYGLPTEAEWEYACRAGTTTPFHFGETITTDLANYCGTDWEYEGKTYSGSYGAGPKGSYREETIEVGRFPANAFGLFDMHGNVWEWCADDWHDNYADKREALKQDGNTPWLFDEPLAAEEAKRSLRGGSWLSYPRYCRSAFRDYYPPGERINNLGFRVVCRAARTLK